MGTSTIHLVRNSLPGHGAREAAAETPRPPCPSPASPAQRAGRRRRDPEPVLAKKCSRRWDAPCEDGKECPCSSCTSAAGLLPRAVVRGRGWSRVPAATSQPQELLRHQPHYTSKAQHTQTQPLRVTCTLWEVKPCKTSFKLKGRAVTSVSRGVPAPPSPRAA